MMHLRMLLIILVAVYRWSPLLKNNILEDFNIKNEYLQCLNAYIEARTPEKREEAHLQLKEQYEAYQIFLKKAETN